MLTALLVLAAISLFTTLVAIIVMLSLLINMYGIVRESLLLEKVNVNRTGSIEKVCVAIHTLLISELNNRPPPQPMGMPPNWTPMGITQRTQDGKFVTEDGRHEADTLEELIHKLSSDPRYRVADESDVDKLRQAFEKNAAEEGYEEGESDEEPPGEEWRAP